MSNDTPHDGDAGRLADLLRRRADVYHLDRQKLSYYGDGDIDLLRSMIDSRDAELREARARIAALETVEMAAKQIHDALRLYYESPCPVCSGDCGSANPPVYGCPSRQAYDAITAYKNALATLSAAPAADGPAINWNAPPTDALRDVHQAYLDNQRRVEAAADGWRPDRPGWYWVRLSEHEDWFPYRWKLGRRSGSGFWVGLDERTRPIEIGPALLPPG